MADDELWEWFRSVVEEEREVLGDVIEALAEVDERRLYEKKGWRTMFEYCVYSRRWSESAAFRRIRAARATRLFPPILELLRAGRLHLEGVVILHAFIEDEDFPALLLRCADKTVKEIEALVADRRTDAPLRDSIRFVGMSPVPPPDAVAPAALAPPPDTEADSAGVPNSAAEAASPCPVEPSPPAAPIESTQTQVSAAPRIKLVRVSFTADEELYAMVRRAQQLMRHKYPDGRLEGIFRDALKGLIEEKDLGLREAKRASRKAQRAAAKRR